MEKQEQDLSKIHAMLNDDSGYLLDKMAEDERREKHIQSSVIFHISKRLLEIDHAAWELVRAQGRMLEKWAEVSEEKKQELWKDLHEKGNALHEILDAVDSKTVKQNISARL